MAFDPVKAGLFHLKPTIFHSTANEDDAYWASFKNDNPQWIDEALIEWELEQIIKRKPDQQCNDLYSSVSPTADQKQVYDFQTSSGLTQMKMIKKYTYMPTGTTKAYIPLTNWMFHGEPEDRLFTIPLPEKQPLYNLQYFDGCDFVVISPNIEIADKLQRSGKFENVVFTSFVCNHGYYNQIDFSDLENKTVVLLIVNHSGMEIEDAVVESKGFYTYLMDQKKKIKYNELSVIQTAVEYSLSGKGFDSMHKYVTLYKKPTSIAGSEFIFNSKEEYEENYEKATERIIVRNQKVRPYWLKETVKKTEDGEDIEKPSCGSEQLMRGIIARGCITYIIGETGIGKSNLTASLCAYLVNTSQRAPRPFAEKLWTRCKIEGKYDRLKIVYLDFENDKNKLEKRWKDFVVPYLPDDSNGRKVCEENFIMVSKVSDDTNYSLDENFEKLCKLLDEYTSSRGEKGQPVDILVIDTYWAFVHENDTKSGVFRKLITRYPQLAIVVQHHLKDGKSYGRADKHFSADTTVHLSRKGTGTLTTPFTIQIGDKHRMILCDEETKPFEVMLDDKHHFVCVGVDKDGKIISKDTDQVDKEEQTLIEMLVKVYKQKKELADLLGMSPNSLTNKLKKK